MRSTQPKAGSPLPGTRLLTGLLGLLLLCTSLCSCFKRERLVDQGTREGVLHRGIGAELDDLDPAFAIQAADYHVLSALFEGLVGEDPLDSHPVPALAQSWKRSDDSLVFTFQLRSDARWSDGSSLNAADFEASYRRLLTPSLGAKAAPALYVLQGARAFNKGETQDFNTVGVKATGPHTLVLTLAQPTPAFLSMLCQPAWYPVNVKALARTGPVYTRGNPWARPETLVGNGPFVLTEWSINHRIVVTKSKTYWDAASVALKGIHFYPLSVDTEERAFRAGQLHVTDALPAGKAPVYKMRAPQFLRADPQLGTYFYRLNIRIPALHQALVRKALSLAIDRKSIIDSILQGNQAPALAFTPPGMPGYTVPQAAYFAPEEARQLLAQAGYPEGKNFPTLELLFNSSESHRAIAEALQEMWRAELGISVKLVNMEQTSVLNARKQGDYQILRSSWTADYADPANFLELWTTASNDNYTGWSNPAYDKLLAQAAKTGDAPARLKLLKQAEELLMQAPPFIGLYHYTHLYLLDPSVRGWYPNPLDHHPYKALSLVAPPTETHTEAETPGTPAHATKAPGN